jgi:hypothetical protein
MVFWVMDLHPQQQHKHDMSTATKPGKSPILKGGLRLHR